MPDSFTLYLHANRLHYINSWKRCMTQTLFEGEYLGQAKAVMGRKTKDN